MMQDVKKADYFAKATYIPFCMEKKIKNLHFLKKKRILKKKML